MKHLIYFKREKHPCTDFYNKEMNKTWMFHDQLVQVFNIFLYFIIDQMFNKFYSSEKNLLFI